MVALFVCMIISWDHRYFLLRRTDFVAEELGCFDDEDETFGFLAFLAVDERLRERAEVFFTVVASATTVRPGMESPSASALAAASSRSRLARYSSRLGTHRSLP